ncbi:MAG: hypothetical protein GC159_01480 [Phycisphaera sp.]|nr:hypothetical protein [Phycisphaera sp.]
MASKGNGPNPMKFAGIGLELAGVIAVLTWIGYGVDRWLDSAPWGLIGGALIGIVGGLYNVIKDVLKLDQ